MYAVFQNGGKQHRVRQGQTVRLEKISTPAGETVQFHQVLTIADGNIVKIGNPFVSGGKITAEVLAHGRDKKVAIIKFQRRKHFRKHQGHRQWFTDVKIKDIKT